MKELKTIIESALGSCKKEGLLLLDETPEIIFETPKQAEHGDLSTNVAMLLAKAEKKAPRKVAEDIAAKIPVPSAVLTSVSVAGPGFINFKINPLYLLNVLHEIYKKNEDYGSLDFGGGKKVQVEFVSANPTGPLHVGHGRGAVYGDSLARLLSKAGFKVTKEYYLNDAGVQMQTLGKSVWLRMKELGGEKVEFPENCYQGGYIKDIAKEVLALRPRAMTIESEDDFISFCGKYAGEKIHNEIVKDLEDCGVTHEVFFYESTLHKKGKVQAAMEFLKKNGDAYEKEGAVWFRSTKYGDEKDRVLKKSDGTYTYFAADIAYHKDKFDRGFDKVIDVWGADHAGHVPRMKAAIAAIGHNPKDFDAVLIQLVNLMRGGELISMSTRSAQYETLRSLLDEVGKDVCRYFFLMRSHEAQLDFDIELAKSQTMENPVYYIQYAHARISSVFAKAVETGIKLKFSNKIDLNLLNLPDEAQLAKFLGEYPSVIKEAAARLEPHRISFYLLELARKFQSYYTKGKKEQAYRFLSDNKELTAAKCYLLKNIQIVLKNGLTLLGLEAPDRMESKDEL
ncbi:MAG: arginine--tRNA ligase [Deltaproteobacteria bacterium]|nr:arginine--tRNA ligase [Deltaproteobacteria bacterium]